MSVGARYAYVALTDSAYVELTSVMLQSLIESAPTHPVLVMCLEDVTAEQKAAMRAIGPGIETRDIAAIDPPASVAAPHEAWRISLSRLRMLTFEEYDKLLFLESDLIVNDNLDELFSHPPLSACAHHYPLRADRPSLNSGLLLLTPAPALFRRIVEELIHLPSPWPPHRWRKPEQELFIALFSAEEPAARWRARHDIQMEQRWHLLEYHYNAIVGLKRLQSPDWDTDEAKVLHYTCGPKPWQSGERERDTDRRWWAVHDRLMARRRVDSAPRTATSGITDHHWERIQRFVAPEPTTSPPAASPPAVNGETAQRLARYDQPATGRQETHWIVTAADRAFWAFTVAFIASLRDVAHYRGKIGVIDYGFTPAQRDALTHHGITLIEPLRQHTLVIDRYLTTAEHFSDRPDTSIVYFDADIWFTEPFDELFDRPEVHDGKVVAAKDVWECDYYFSCAHEKYHPAIRRMLDELKRRHGQSLQAGFIGGNSGAWLWLTDLLRCLLDRGFAADQWGADALALNLFATLHEHRFKRLPITYNAPPAWGVVQRDGRFHATRFDHDALHDEADGTLPVKAIHRTTPFRGPHQHEELAFERVHPQLFREWSERLSGEEPHHDP